MIKVINISMSILDNIFDYWDAGRREINDKVCFVRSHSIWKEFPASRESKNVIYLDYWSRFYCEKTKSG